MDAQRETVVLVAFYNGKALGVRHLEGALTQAGWRMVTVFFKQFNSQAPAPATDRERCLRYERDCAKAAKLARGRYLRKKAAVALRGLAARRRVLVKQA